MMFACWAVGYSFVDFEGSEVFVRRAESDGFLEELGDRVVGAVRFENLDSWGGR